MTASAVLVSAMAVGTGVSTADSISPAPEQPGNVVRDDSITFTVDSARFYNRSSASGNFSDATNTNPALTTSGCFDGNSPFSTIEVRDPNGNVVLSAEGPAVRYRVGLISPPLRTYRTGSGVQTGQDSISYLLDAAAGRLDDPWTTGLSLAGRPAGTYQVVIARHNKVKTGSGACTTGLPVFNASGSPTNAAPVLGPDVVTSTFEYRPWEETFTDFFNGGNVQFNTTPAEFRFALGNNRTPVYDGSTSMQFYAAPPSAIIRLRAPLDECAANPAACLPTAVVQCDPSQGCDPDFVTIQRQGPNALTGVFDLNTRAFVAFATVGNQTRVLASGGTQVDALLRTTYANLVATAAANGIDLPRLLSKPVVLNVTEGGETTQVTVSLLEGLSITRGLPAPSSTAGQLAAAAGLIIHVGTWSGPDTGNGTSGYGYSVQEAGILPAVPTGLPAPANLLVPGGKLTHVVGRVPAGGGQHINALSVDTSAGEPNGYPVWLPLASIGSVKDNGVEFLGTDMLVLSVDVCLLGQCAGAGALVGTGIALYPGSLLDTVLSISDLFIWNDCTAGLTVSCPTGPIDAVDQLDAAIAGAATTVLSNPAVAQVVALLDPVIGPVLDDALGGLPL